jgi:hypothetical protein
MKLREASSNAIERSERMIGHEIVIGPLCDSALFGHKARLYYCKRCKWSFLVFGNQVAVLDEGGSPSGGNDGFSRFIGDQEACPVLETFALEALKEASVTARVWSARR